MEPKRFSPVFCAFRIPENAVFTSRAAFLSASLKKSQNVNNIFQRKLEKSRFQEFVNKVTKPRLIPKKIALDYHEYYWPSSPAALLLTQRPPFSIDHHLYSDKNHPHFFQVLVTNLDVESVTHLEPANFWIGPSAVSALLSPSALQDKCLGLSWRIR